MQSAGGASIKDGRLTLTSPSIAYFSDRPHHVMGHINCASFVRLWADHADSLHKDPPSAVLSTFAPNGRHTHSVVRLRNPRMEGSDLVYDAHLLEGTLPAEKAEAQLLINDGRMRGCKHADRCFEAWGRPAKMSIAPAEITDRTPSFFIGTGDGAAGFWTTP